MTALGSHRIEHVASRYPLPEAQAAVQRPELFERLDAGQSRRLTLLTGAPGSGKTMLLSTWLAARPALGPSAWMSVKLSDGSSARFWTEFVELVATAAQRPPFEGLPDPGEVGFETALAEACCELVEPVIIVLDDFEQLRSSKITRTLDRLLRIPHARIRVIIASRRDPGLSLQRLRLAGELLELRSADLAFTCDQARELFELAGVELNEDQVKKLHDRTEGWVGGLRLAALSLQARADPEPFVSGFAGDERTIADYLLEEVLNQQPAQLREFMLLTSVVEEIEPELANALTGHDNGAETLAHLDRSNAFLLPLDDHRQRYRYHAMFLELLRTELSYRMPDAFALGHRRAARWYAARGEPASAVHHAVIAGDLDAAAEMLCDRWLTLIIHGDGRRLADWIDGLPQQVVTESPEIAVAAAGAALADSDLEKAVGYVALADARAGDVPPKRRARYTLSRGILAMLDACQRADYVATRTAAHRVLSRHQLTDLPDDTRAVAHLCLGVAQCWSAEPEGVDHLEQALELARAASCDFLVVDALGQLGLFKVLRGMLTAGRALAQEAVSIAIAERCDEQPVIAAAYLALAIAWLNRADIQRGGEQLRRAQQAVGPGRGRVARCLIDLFRAQVTAYDDVGEAIRLAHATAEQSERWKLPQILATSATFYEAAFAVQNGQPERAGAALAQGELSRRAPVEHAIVTARVALSGGHPIEALRELAPDETHGPQAMHPSTRIEAIALSALCKHQLHDDVGALALVEQALELAQPEGYRMPLLKIGPPLRELLKRRIRAGTSHRGLAADLIDRLDSSGQAALQAPVVLLDPLSDREEAVLRYLPTVMSKSEIASELFVSVNTIKTHIKNIYRKLGVASRTDAVRRAKSLNLI